MPSNLATEDGRIFGNDVYVQVQHMAESIRDGSLTGLTLEVADVKLLVCVYHLTEVIVGNQRTVAAKCIVTSLDEQSDPQNGWGCGVTGPSVHVPRSLVASTWHFATRRKAHQHVHFLL